MSNSIRLINELVGICGAESVSTEKSDRSLLSSDLYQSGCLPDVIVSPKTREQISHIVKLARSERRPLFVRGGGRSYSNAFLPGVENAILIDTRDLKKIREIDIENMYVTVESGCTWARLDAALMPYGVRSRFWGPASGLRATIGGSMSQGTANNASATHGTSSDAVLSYEIVTGTGDLLNTGLDAQSDRLAVYRPYGPDLTGLFNADAGAFGIKTAVTLKLEARPKFEGGVSFAFESYERLVAGMRSAAGQGEASAIIAMDADTANIRSGPSGLVEDFKKFVTIIRTAHNPFRGLARGGKIALAGRRVFERAKYTAHFLAEAPSGPMLGAKESVLRKAVGPHGDEIPSAAISMMRAELFPDLPTTHFDGRRQLPIHGILAWSRLTEFEHDYAQVLLDFSQEMKEHNVILAVVLTVLGQSAVLVEPIFYWPDAPSEFHTSTRPDHLGPVDALMEENQAARALVETMRRRIIDLYDKHGAAHLQIGKAYPFLTARQNTNLEILNQLKKLFDPDGIINPGSLGL